MSQFAAYKKPLAYSKALVSRRKLGERIGLLVVGLHDWHAGVDLEARSGTARIVLPEDSLPHEMDWAPAVALDCLVVGECQEAVFYAAVTMLHAAGAASLWGSFADGAWRLERYVSKATPQGFYATDGPVPAGKIGQALKMHRDHSLMTRRGLYGTPPYAQARLAVFRNVFGDKAEVVQGMLDKRMAA